MIEFTHVSKSFPHKHQFMKHQQSALDVLQDISFSIADREFVSLVGPSGCGKSTILRLIAGLLQPDEGEILVNGKVAPGPGRDRCVVFQDYVLFPWMNVWNNISLGLRVRHLDKDTVERKTKWAIELVGLGEFANMYPEQLSGGMKQRVAIARALVMNPEIMLMDEPFGALDPLTRRKLQDELVRLCHKKDFTTIFVTHDPEEAVYLSDKIIVFTGSPSHIAEVIDVRLEGPRDRQSPEFQAIRDRILMLGRLGEQED